MKCNLNYAKIYTVGTRSTLIVFYAFQADFLKQYSVSDVVPSNGQQRATKTNNLQHPQECKGLLKFNLVFVANCKIDTFPPSSNLLCILKIKKRHTC